MNCPAQYIYCHSPELPPTWLCQGSKADFSRINQGACALDVASPQYLSIRLIYETNFVFPLQGVVYCRRVSVIRTACEVPNIFVHSMCGCSSKSLITSSPATTVGRGSNR